MSKFNSSIVVAVPDPMFLGGFRYDVRVVRFDRDNNVDFSYEHSTYSLRSLFYDLRKQSRKLLWGYYYAVFAPAPSGCGEVCIWTSPVSDL